EPRVREFIERLAPAETESDRLVAKGDEDSLRQALDLDPDHEGAILKLSELLAERGGGDEALALLARVPAAAEGRHAAALARIRGTDAAEAEQSDVESRLDELLERAKDDATARQEFVDLLELLGPDDPRTPRYRRALTSRLY